MKNKKVIITLLVIVLILGAIGYFIYQKIQENKQEKEMTEYIPEEEIDNAGLRQTVVSVYFNQKDTNTLIPEARRIDVKELTKDPYNILIKMLIEGPKNEGLEKVIPDGTKINKVELKGNIVHVDFSKEFIDNHKGGAEAESRTVYAIVNTLTRTK